MKFLIIDTYYPSFLKSFRHKYPESLGMSYQEQRQFLLDQKFGTSDFYSGNFKKLGHQAEDIIVNDLYLQFRWAQERNFFVSESRFKARMRVLLRAYHLLGPPRWIQEIALAQIQEYKPDIIYIHNLTIFSPDYFQKIKKQCQFVVGQIACPLPPKIYWENYDLIVTSFPHFVQRFRQQGIKSEYLKIAFEPHILDLVSKQPRIYNVSFIGSYSYHHKGGTQILEDVARKVKVDFWGLKQFFMSPFSPIGRRYHGSAWGLDMYTLLAQSRIVINRHIGAAQNYANNMRLYESTGMGALLITDMKDNLNHLFHIGKEIIAYSDVEDLVDKIRYYLEHEKERAEIAQAGQQRTLQEHTYENRMKELLTILAKYL
ncbi:MAG: hypothetical protein A3B74_00615 [Candidatus Kerfeldbacteria bacterium RIFCSPHIGHO2_02_FULL_42_14]|uniref:Spore protein YkvP/CgeB glycosyl transferase-like domain-containing protein n=1 Tax=Candidatus Kerfeldbacteria bacterium RIFCSPHIGHO2_02_FULL_42_14 TaxID=1798540 RepID=A0A1G2AQZ6_9BACT|nr:MAG: hypothetical protein A3B74_00615 [Candidatus Kerfeldbacteria bacterium RIFCSPHIGHO2_02_FULL_42_14]OGY81457.1 MAG: hypothetical protein A3E60_05530 [Candidatus Kerfeldbacteria bacterium RIFCSPHIGHO2_12_FULL_42_13]OGY83504.1 MAG: hypothetical protein A3I91_02560 [Candidatus Kerfeldbacteria bacterium RIFCSPLOWO2_02_FULL_42_19]OGY86970.1 MAG: hypothetical protein A3G01_01650 [Candidatus Kerfeldbacteria bacterium RIFCSPLOWO2_12_FULL_43_9]